MRRGSWELLKQFLAMSLWQQIAAGLIVAAILAGVRWLGRQLAAIVITAAFWRAIGWLGREVIGDLVAVAVFVLIGLVWRMLMRPAPKSPEQLIRLSPEVGAKPPESFWSYDFIEHFNEAYGSLEDLQSVSIETACCGGIPKRAIYQHPPPQGKSVIRYFVPIPEAVGIFRLECFIGIKDGSEIDRDPKNVVLFEVAVGGTWAVLSETYAGKRWARVNRGPIPGSGEYTSIEFITDACGNNEWDWAVWGEPKLVQVE